MSRPAPILRCAAVWLAVTVAVVALQVWLSGDLARVGDVVADAPSKRTSFDDLLVTVAATTVSGGALWVWFVTTVVSLEAARGGPADASRPVGSGCPTALRRLLLAACGIAVASGVAAGLAAPALAHRDQPRHSPPGPALLAGLRLPDRAVTRPAPEVPRAVRVQTGDTLWGLAAAALAPNASDLALATAWRAIYRTNRAAIGPDPDLILPGTTLTIPDLQEETR